MKIAMFSAKPYDRESFERANSDDDHEIDYLEAHLGPETVVVAEGIPAVCVFVHDHRAHNRVREGNFSLQGLLGFDLNLRTVGIVGTGKIGAVVARILRGFGCHLLANDATPNMSCEDLGVRYVDKETLLGESDIITLHCPLTAQTHHLIDQRALLQVKRGVMLINTSRGALVDTRAVIEALKDGRVGSLGLDVYEEEDDLFFEDLSEQVIQDDVFSRLLTFPNVIVTAHQGYFTQEAVAEIAATTLQNVTDFERGRSSSNEVSKVKKISGPRVSGRAVV